jgi:hypothetical protein
MLDSFDRSKERGIYNTVGAIQLHLNFILEIFRRNCFCATPEMPRGNFVVFSVKMCGGRAETEDFCSPNAPVTGDFNGHSGTFVGHMIAT